MRALITGGAGFIGSSIARALLARGDEVRILDNLLTGFEENIPPEAEFFRGDLRELDNVRRACDGMEVVFHQGAFRSVPKSVDNPTMANDCNVTGTLHVLIGAVEADVRRVVYASSSSAYGESGVDIQHEELTPRPSSPYAVSKLAGEYYCRTWTAVHGLSTVSLRYFNVFGPGQHPESKYAALFPGFISKLVAGEAPEVHWDGEQSRDFTFIEDVVRANLAAAEAPDEASGKPFNIGGGRPKTVNEVLKAVTDALGVWIDPVHTPKRQGDIRSTHADISRARDILGWEPKADWDEAVQATVDWFQKR